METTRSSISCVEALLEGKDMLCTKCKQGHYRPFNPKFEINHSFVCDICGNSIHWDPVVDVD